VNPARDALVVALRARGIVDPRVLAAIGDVPREEFVPLGMAARAYDDVPLGIGWGQTISQPLVVALTVAALELTGDERVLEVGTGSGYGAAVLARLAKRVDTIERLDELAVAAAARLARLGYSVTVHRGDGSQGLAARAPFDAIAVAAGAPAVPAPLIAQLAVGGRLVVPVGDEADQRLVRITRIGVDTYVTTELCNVRFVPLIGADAWPER
jgi:protein-L-isoaspartate(D-aspartate) O-methyltransferase